MSLLAPNVGEVELLSRALNKSQPDNVVLHLYTNDKTPAETDTVADYTEATAAGYAPITLTGANWIVTSVAGVTTAVYPEQDFNLTDAEPAIYGYYITNNDNSILLWSERRVAGHYTVPAGGGVIPIVPKISLE